MFLLRFQASSHTLSLTLNGVNLDLTRSFISCCVILCAANASFLASLRVFSHSSTARSWAVLTISGRACTYPSHSDLLSETTTSMIMSF